MTTSAEAKGAASGLPPVHIIGAGLIGTSAGLALRAVGVSILIELADLQTVAAVINHALNRQIEPVLPQLVETGGGWQFRYPQPRPRGTAT